MTPKNAIEKLNEAQSIVEKIGNLIQEKEYDGVPTATEKLLTVLQDPILNTKEEDEKIYRGKFDISVNMCEPFYGVNSPRVCLAIIKILDNKKPEGEVFYEIGLGIIRDRLQNEINKYTIEMPHSGSGNTRLIDFSGFESYTHEQEKDKINEMKAIRRYEQFLLSKEMVGRIYIRLLKKHDEEELNRVKEFILHNDLFQNIEKQNRAIEDILFVGYSKEDIYEKGRKTIEEYINTLQLLKTIQTTSDNTMKAWLQETLKSRIDKSRFGGGGGNYKFLKEFDFFDSNRLDDTNENAGFFINIILNFLTNVSTPEALENRETINTIIKEIKNKQPSIQQ